MTEGQPGFPGINQAFGSEYMQPGIKAGAVLFDHRLQDGVSFLRLDELEGLIHETGSLGNGLCIGMRTLNRPIFTHMQDGITSCDLNPQGMVEDEVKIGGQKTCLLESISAHKYGWLQ